ncbi:helix-turn-helix transcriptional regulator [Cytobacillus oceanisediminis]|uniref:Transcriptional regulator n=1 Tax=Cytobacillus oceanisediminis TaxID=665099 RepID=A0ABX3CJS8_9BACI|nr:helix-turn-helix transcriptional regulator [Cytobacillus oceanisediminis]OHX39201.1 transcriptional regulator [Cytobacillus oceanisediminis]
MPKRSNYRKWLADIRDSLSLTQEEVANKANMARTTYASIEKGDRNPSVNNAKKIADALGFEWTLFFEDKVREKSRNSIQSA